MILTINKLYIAISFNIIELNDPKYFKLEFLQGDEYFDLEGKKTINLLQKDLESCSLDHFPQDLTQNILTRMKNISNLLCPPKNLNINIEGTYSSEIFSYISIKLSKCENTTNITCVSDETLNQIFEKDRVYLNVYFSNHIIKANDFDNPITTFIDDRVYVLVDQNSYKEKNYFLF